MRRYTRVILAALLSFGGAIVLASGDVEWTTGSEATAAVQATVPETGDTRRARELSDAFIAIATAVTPSVVRIETEQSGAAISPGMREFFGMPEGDHPPIPQRAGGSGFIVSSNGYVLTNNHVVEGAERIYVTLVDKRTYDAEVIGHDPTTDVAVIKIDAKNLPALQLGNSDRARVGEWVLAIGNPGFGDASTLDFTVTSGIISAKGRPLNIINRELMAAENPVASYAIEDFLQTDAVINPGNSGGPLVNLRGEVVGINTAIASGTGFYQGYGFAIPANLVRQVMEDLIEHGRVRRALLGINIANVTPEDAEVYALPEISGVLIEDFAPQSPAEASGLRRHDVIVELDGARIERVGQLQRLVAQHRPGETVEVGIIRYGEPHRFRTRLIEAPLPAQPEPTASAAPLPRGLGIEVADLTPSLARQLGFDRAGGVIVADVRPMSAAQRRGIRNGDRILAIGREPVRSAREAAARIENARSGDVLSLLLQLPDGRTHIVNIRVP